MKSFFENLNKYWMAPLIAIVGGLLGLYFTFVKSGLDVQAKNLQNTALNIETQLKEKEFSNVVKLQMYTEVKEAIIHNDQKLQSAVLLIINEMLADDSVFRDKLIDLLHASPNTNDSVKVEIQTMQNSESDFYSEQPVKKENKFTIDVFYLENIKKESLPLAKEIKELLSSEWPSYTIRLRLLPRAINAKSGFQIDNNEIRFDKDKEAIAQKCLSLIKAKKIFVLDQPLLKEIPTVTPNYLSIFVRNK